MPDPTPEAACSPSVTTLIVAAKEGDPAAYGPLWDKYFPKLVAAVQARLRAARVAVADGEDAALSALDSFFERAKAGRFPRLDDRDDLWRLLLTIVHRKTAGLIRREYGAVRGGGRVVRASEAGADPAAEAPGGGPDPAETAEHAEEVVRLLGLLGEGGLRQIAILRMEGYSNEETARRVGLSVPTVERRLHLIRTIWGREHGPD